MTETALFLVQAKAGLPRIYRCLKSKPHLLLSYQEETAETTIYAPDTTWASGRNKLFEYVKANRLRYKYYVFMDEDVVFYGRSQQNGFDALLSLLASCDYPVITARLMGLLNAIGTDNFANHIPEALGPKGLENLQWALQTVDWFDGILNAFSHDAFHSGNLLPYPEQYDKQSWHTSQFTVILRANHHYRNRIVQCNKMPILNTGGSEYPGSGVDISGEAIYRSTLDQLGVDAIEMSTGVEIGISKKIRLDAGWCQKLWWYMRYPARKMRVW